MDMDTQKLGDTFCLNLRFMLITLVFAGNALEPLLNQIPSAKALFLWIFTFHMPLFVFVTGNFAKHNLTGESGMKVLKLIAAQYFIFQTLYSLADYFIFRVPGIKHSFFMPYLLVWFLLSHFFWRLLLMLSIRLKLKHPIFAATAAGILVGYLEIDGSFLSVSRTFVYLPFFFVGYYFNYAKFVKHFTGSVRTLAGALSILLLELLYIYAGDVQPGWLFGSFTFGQLGHAEWYAGLLRIGIYALECIALLAFLAWVPRRESRMTELGKRTVYVFLIHGFVIRLMAASGLYAWITHPVLLVPLLAFVVLFTILLAQPRVRDWTGFIIEPSTVWVDALQEKVIGSFRTIRVKH